MERWRTRMAMRMAAVAKKTSTAGVAGCVGSPVLGDCAVEAFPDVVPELEPELVLEPEPGLAFELEPALVPEPEPELVPALVPGSVADELSELG